MTGRSSSIGRAVWLAAVIFTLLAAAAGALDGPLLRTFVLADPQIEAASDSLKVIVPGVADSGRMNEDTQASGRSGGDARIVGTSLLSSGIFLCSWGIVSWQFEDDQCCPARNTENVLKIIVGVVLVNAGLIYLLGGAD